MTNLDAMCQQTFAHHRDLLAQAARERLRSSDVGRQGQTLAMIQSFRVAVASWLRRLADRLEPVADRPRVAMLRAVAHNEISVDQALRLLDERQGQRSAIV